MQRLGWPSTQPPDELGAVVHGPIELARQGDSIAVGARCVFAHRTGLHVPVVLVAAGVHATAAQRQQGHGAAPAGEAGSWSWLELSVQLNGRTGQVHPFGESSSGGSDGSGEDSYQQESQYWIGELPADGRLVVTVAWPQVGLAASTRVVRLGHLDRAIAGVVPLL